MQNPNEGVKTHFECDFCNKDNASMKCSKCRCAFYCSAECQAKHWKVEHKKACKEFCRHIANMESENLRISYYENDEVNECSLCMDPVGELPLELACKHQYCMMCVEENIPLNKPVEMQCPLCAEDLTKNVQRSVYDKAIRFCRMAFAVEHKEGKQDLLLKFIELAQLNFDLLKASAEKNNYPLEIDVRSIEVSILMLRKEFDSCISLALSILNQTPRPDEDLAMELMSSVATCYVRQKKYAEAKNAFTDMYRIISEPEKFPQVQRKIVFETSRCEYELGNYKRSIEIGELAVEMNRHYEDVYKYIILSFVALERIDLAMQVCKRAIRYEVPWDIEHRQKLEAQLKELQEKNKSEG